MGWKLLVVSPTSKFGGTEKCALTVAAAAPGAHRGDAPLWEHEARGPPKHRRGLSDQGFGARVMGGGDVVDRRSSARGQMLRMLGVRLGVRPDVVHVNVPWPDRCFGIL